MNIQDEIQKLDDAITKATEAKNALIEKAVEKKREPQKGEFWADINGNPFIVGSEYLTYINGNMWKRSMHRSLLDGVATYIGKAEECLFTREQIKEKFMSMKDEYEEPASRCKKYGAPYHIRSIHLDDFIDNLLDDKHESGEPKQ